MEEFRSVLFSRQATTLPGLLPSQENIYSLF